MPLVSGVLAALYKFVNNNNNNYNAVLAGLPASTLAPLQRILNAAARFVAGATSRTHVSGIMKSLHWLTIAYRIRFKYMAFTTEPVLRI